MRIIRPGLEGLPSYVAALERGWSPDNVRGAEATREELERIGRDAALFVAEQEDPEGRLPPVKSPDGTSVPRLPGYRRWMWDGEFCGVIGFRWQRGTEALPPTCLGHIGYNVVPWKRRLGYATEALKQILPDARTVGLAYVEITTDPENLPSQRVIEANGGVLIERFKKPEQYGNKEGLRYRVMLRPS